MVKGKTKPGSGSESGLVLRRRIGIGSRLPPGGVCACVSMWVCGYWTPTLPHSQTPTHSPAGNLTPRPKAPKKVIWNYVRLLRIGLPNNHRPNRNRARNPNLPRRLRLRSWLWLWSTPLTYVGTWLLLSATPIPTNPHVRTASSLLHGFSPSFSIGYKEPAPYSLSLPIAKNPPEAISDSDYAATGNRSTLCFCWKSSCF